MNNHHHYFLLLVVLMLVIVPSVISGPLSVKPDVKIDLSTSANATSGKTSDKLDLHQPSFWENFFKGFIDALPEEPADSGDSSDSSECCSGVEDRIADLENTIGDLQNKVDEMEARQNAPCQQITIESGSCQTACERQGLKCAASHYRRTFLDEGVFGGVTRTLIYAEFKDCDEDFYFPADPEVQDEYQCSCC